MWVVAGNIAGEIDKNPQSFLQQTGLPVQWGRERFIEVEQKYYQAGPEL